MKIRCISLLLFITLINSGTCLEKPNLVNSENFSSKHADKKETGEVVSVDPVITNYPNEDSKHVNFYLYTRETLKNPENVDSRNLTIYKNLKRGKPIRMTIHGWKGFNNDIFSTSMRENFLSGMDVNVITVDWSGHESQAKLYPTARYQVPEVGRLVAEFVDFLVENQRVRLSDIHVLGHSLGAHVAGVAGQRLKAGKFARVTGLDPAGPEFYMKYPQTRLSTESAQFVDVVHTAVNILGFAEAIGHVDFYPNGGQAAQPGCGVDYDGSCSHSRSHELYLESITRPKSYPAITCENWSVFMQHSCRNTTSIAYMGEKTSKSVRGSYYFQSNKESPFGRDMSGIFYTPIVSEEPSK